jgi:hypothetical protein
MSIAGGYCREFITATGAGTFTVPSNWNSSNNTIEVIGGGGGGFGNGVTGTQAAGGGGGAYAIKNNLALTRGASITVGVGAGGPGGPSGNNGTDGGDTFFNRTAGGSNTCADTTSVCAKGGQVESVQLVVRVAWEVVLPEIRRKMAVPEVRFQIIHGPAAEVAVLPDQTAWDKMAAEKQVGAQQLQEDPAAAVTVAVPPARRSLLPVLLMALPVATTHLLPVLLAAGAGAVLTNQRVATPATVAMAVPAPNGRHHMAVEAAVAEEVVLALAALWRGLTASVAMAVFMVVEVVVEVVVEMAGVLTALGATAHRELSWLHITHRPNSRLLSRSSSWVSETF